MSALNPYAVTPERRTDSKPFRRRFARKTGFDSCRRKLLLNYFRQSFESSPESRGSQTSGVLPVLFVQAKRIKPFPFGSSRFCKPRISTPNQQLRTNPIKTFWNFAKFSKPRFSAPQPRLHAHQLKPFESSEVYQTSHQQTKVGIHLQNSLHPPSKHPKICQKPPKTSKRRKERVKKAEKRGKKCKKGLTKGEESGNIIKLRKGAGARETRKTGRMRKEARNCDLERTKMSKRNLKKVLKTPWQTELSMIY